MSSQGLHDPHHGLKGITLQPWLTSTNLDTWLEAEPDPVAVVYTATEPAPADRTQSTLYLNKILRCSERLQTLIAPAASLQNVAGLTSDQRDFQRWFRGQCTPTSANPRQSLLLEGYLWSTTALDLQRTILRGVQLPGDSGITFREAPYHVSGPPPFNDVGSYVRPSSTVFSHGGDSVTSPTELSDLQVTQQSRNKIRCFMSEPLTAHQAFVRRFSWSATPIGPMSTWDSQLIETVSLTLTNTDPAAVFWGTEMTSIYNEAFISIAGQKHPAMMGDAPRRAFAEVWDQYFEQRIQLSRRTKEPFCEQGLCLLLERRGFPEETFMTFTFLPLLGHSGEVVGFYHTVYEETQQVLSKRRMSLLLHISEILSKAQSLQTFWGLLLESLTDAEYDTPFVTLYSVIEQKHSDAYETLTNPDSDMDISTDDSYHLEGSLGYPADHEVLLESFCVRDDTTTLAPIFRTSMKSRAPQILSLQDDTLPQSLICGLQRRGYGNDCNTVAICPLRPTNHDTALGFLTIGLSSRRPCDEDYQSFVNLLVKNISSSLASVVLLEDEKRRGLNNAERALYERALLTARLQEREIENQLQEHKFMLMAHQVPVGIFDLSPSGEINFCNQAWFEMTGHNRGDTSRMSWMSNIHQDDIAMVQEQWITVSVHRQPVSFEARLKIPWQAEPGDNCSVNLDSTWFLSRMYPVLADDGSVVNIIGSFTDISFQKYSMAQQVRRVEEAIEAKRQQENFVDMTSHEMRNPLNAMLLCAQELSGTLQEMLTGGLEMSTTNKEAVASSIESAETIIYCGRHQKRIIDDVLTLSKLDARLLQINPIEVQPVMMVQETLRLFESEVRAQGIDVRLTIQESMQQLSIKSVLLDPSRVVQILVNFIANAIKFTKTEETRQMSVTIGALIDKPSEAELAAAQIHLIPPGGYYQDPTLGQEWGQESPVYLQFTVCDTGPGISNNDMLRLFHRFTQAQPKTHAHYGGSGLGLFISQQLAELQGGRVGIASEPGIGSSFYFYIKCRRSKGSAPMAQIDDGAVVGTGIPKSPSKSPKGLSTHRAPNTISLLIVEDNLVNQKVLKRQLQKLGYDVMVANHGEEALEIIAKSRLYRRSLAQNTDPSDQGGKLDLILMDIEMPVMDGRECIQKIREWERQGRLRMHIPTIALTANARVDQIKSAKTYGFDEVVSKPFRLAEIVNQISKFLDYKANNTNGLAIT